MAWQISQKGTNKSIFVEVGRPAQTIPGGDADGCIGFAVAPDVRPQRLVLILPSTRGVRFRNRRVICPIVVIDGEGGELSVERMGTSIDVHISLSDGAVAESNSNCGLCRGPLVGEAMIRQCPRCEATYHAGCIRGLERCPACFAKLPWAGSRMRP